MGNQSIGVFLDMLVFKGISDPNEYKCALMLLGVVESDV
jgi:hypothetical protein